MKKILFLFLLAFSFCSFAQKTSITVNVQTCESSAATGLVKIKLLDEVFEQTLLNGSAHFEFIPTNIIQSNLANPFSIAISPNPVKGDKVTLTCKGYIGQEPNFSFYDVMGKKLGSIRPDRQESFVLNNYTGFITYHYQDNVNAHTQRGKLISLSNGFQFHTEMNEVNNEEHLLKSTETTDEYTITFINSKDQTDSIQEIRTIPAGSNEIINLQTDFDNTPPTASNPETVYVLCSDAIPEPDISVVTDEADNCTSEPEVLFQNDISDLLSCPETVTRTYSITDNAGNSTLVEQTIIIGGELLKPTLLCPGDIYQKVNSGQTSANISIPVPSVEESCSDISIVNDFNNTGDASDQYPIGTTYVKWIATDACGNADSCTMLVIVDSVQNSNKILISNQEDFDIYNNKTFQPGDEILFKRGEKFIGMFKATGEGTAEAPIIIDTYGEGDRPFINAQGKKEAGLLLINISYWEVNGLEITSPYKNKNGYIREDGNATGDILPEVKLFGILVRLDGEEKEYKHIYINDCYIHDVNDIVGKKDLGGIHVRMYGLKRSWVDDLRITNNRINRVGGVGIANHSDCGKVRFTVVRGGVEDYENEYLWTNVYVADNVVDYTGRNNIIARVSVDAIYERNVLAYSSRAATGNAMFCFNTCGIKFQYNEAYGNTGLGVDRGGFDADYNCVKTYIQYNYSHDNNWFCAIMRRDTRGVYIRYNVSQNERKAFIYYGFRVATFAKEVHIYNNTYFTSTGNTGEIVEGNTGALNTTLQNNIFFFEDAGSGSLGSDNNAVNVVWNNNVYYHLPAHPDDANAKTQDPKFVDPRIVPYNIDLKTMQQLNGYRLQEDSPYQDGATPIPNNGGKNILGEPIDPDRYGAF